MTKEIQIISVRKFFGKWFNLANRRLGFHMLAESVHKI
jgi:hypothetical protein